MSATLARRYIFKLAANLISVPIYLLMESLLPRALGPQTYGNYNFAVNLFQQFSGFLDMGTSTCFYNALSRRQNETGIFSFYLRVSVGVSFLILFAGFFIFIIPDVGSLLMPDIPLWLAPLAALWAFLTWCGRVLRSANDALGVTISSELWRALLSIAGAAAICLLFFSHTLDIKTLFVQQFLLLGAMCVAYWHVTWQHWKKNNIQPTLKIDKYSFKNYCSEFFDYSHPLFIQALLAFFMLASERWLLQWFYGSAQQGFFALSQKVSAACFLFVSAMTPLLMREFSIAWGHGDLKAMGALLSRFAPLLYLLAAYFSCFTFAEAKAIVEIFGGSEFVPAILPVQVMSLYPIHQAYGQVAGSIFHASSKTNILRNIAVFECVYGLIMAWVFLAPSDLCGFNLGAFGLAIKTVGAQFITVNIYLWLASRFVPFKFWHNLAHQICSILILILLAFLCRELTADIIRANFLIRFLASGCLYTLGVFGLCFIFPSLMGMTRNDVRDLIRRFKNFIHQH